MSNVNAGFSKPFLLQVATKGEVEKCDSGFLLAKYNGHPGEDISDVALENRGCNYDFYWKDRKTGAVQGGWPLRVRAGGYAAIPDLPENHKILAAMKARKWSVRVETESGHINKTVNHPPLYELVAEEVAQVSPDALVAAIMNMSPEQRQKLLGAITEPVAQVPAPVRTREDIEGDIAAHQAVIDDSSASNADKKASMSSKKALEAELAALG